MLGTEIKVLGIDFPFASNDDDDVRLGMYKLES